MDLLEKKQHYILLFDFYENLLTKKQKEYFKYYYFDDLSLAEIAQMYQVSRSAIFDHIKKLHTTLDGYEEKLLLVEKFMKREEIFQRYDSSENEEVQTLLRNLKEIE